MPLVGYYSWNWGAGSFGPPGTSPETGIAFTGLSDIPTAIAQYTAGASWCCPQLKGQNGPWITLGGGNAAGLFNQATLTK